MSKYGPLWIWIKNNGNDRLRLGFDEIETILGFGIGHSFLTFKKELTEFGFAVSKVLSQ